MRNGRRRRSKTKLIINEVPLSKNKYVNMHWAKRMKYKNDIAWLFTIADIRFATNELNKNKYPLKKAKVTFDIYFKINRRRDVANYLGGGLIAWLDTLVDFKYIKDDSYDVIGQPIVNFHVDKIKQRTEITIEGR